MNALGQARVNFQIERLVPQINRSHAAAQEAGRDMLQHMLEAGKGLAAMKEVVKHGEFEAAIERECEFSVRTGQLYMKLFHSWPRIEEQVGEQEAANLSLQGALKLIQTVKPAKEAGAKAEKAVAEAAQKRNGSAPFTPTGATTPDICPKGGDHEWVHDEDEGEEVCEKCHEPGGMAEATGAEEVGADVAASECKSADSRPVSSGKHFQEADAAFVTLIRALDHCQRGYSHEKLYGDVIQSLNCAYDDFKLWRKAFRQ